jgi:hypothetical protein
VPIGSPIVGMRRKLIMFIVTDSSFRKINVY